MLVFVTGLADDVFGLKPWQKLLGITAAAGLACWGGLRIEGLVFHEIGSALGVLLTIVWLVGITSISPMVTTTIARTMSGYAETNANIQKPIR